MKIRGQKKLKLLDRYLGVPLVFLFGFLKRKKEFPQTIKSIGILLTPAIGDTILISAPLKDLKEKLSSPKIILFVPEENREAAELINIADEIISIDLTKILKAIRIIRSRSFNIFIDSSQWARISSLLTFFSRSELKIGFDTKNQYRKNVYDLSIVHSDKVHEITNYRNLISPTGINSNRLPEIESGNSKYDDKISIHINAGGYLSYLKEWPVENWISVIEYLRSKKFRIFFTGSQNDYYSIENLLNNFTTQENLYNLAGKFTLKETADHVKSCKLVLSVNTGIMHITSAAGTNLIVLHGPTNPLRWGPLNKNSVSIKSSYFSAPCLNLGFEYNCKDRSGECMKAITVTEVINAIDHFID